MRGFAKTLACTAWRARHYNEPSTEMAQLNTRFAGARRSPTAFALGCILLSACGSPNGVASESGGERRRRPNVLLICVDDLRPELGCYGATDAQTPHLDRFAREAHAFSRHYAVFPTCGASRAAMLFGRLPSAPAHWTNAAFDAGYEKAGAQSLPEVFRHAGYRTVGLGKVSHSPDGRRADGSEELAGAWDELATDPGPWRRGRELLHAYANGRVREAGKSPLFEAADVEDHAYPDGRLAAQAVAALQSLAQRNEPFFLAVGFYKPHLPFAAPRAYWNRFDPDRLELTPDGQRPLRLLEPNSARQSGEVTGNYGSDLWDDQRSDAAEERALRHGYLAATSFVDAQIGKVLTALTDSGVADETLVVIWGDHGWHLGEQGLMGKHTTFEASLRSALLIRVPDIHEPGSVRTEVTSSLDIFPTLCELASVEQPAGLAGRSFAANLRGSSATVRDVAPSFWKQGGQRAEVLRSDRWRFVRWSDWNGGTELAVELYDMQHSGERRNVADERAKDARALRTRLAEQGYGVSDRRSCHGPRIDVGTVCGKDTVRPRAR